MILTGCVVSLDMLRALEWFGALVRGRDILGKAIGMELARL